MKTKLFKIAMDLLRWGEGKFETKAGQIITAMTTEPMLTLVPDPLPAVAGATRAQALTALGNYKTAALAAADGSKAAIKDRDEKRAILEGILRMWAVFLEQTALQADDITILTKSGYTLHTPVVPVPGATPPAPIIAVKRGAISGGATVSVKPVLKGIPGYEAEYTIGDPTVGANYTGRISSTTGSRIKFTGLEVGKLHNFRVRGVNGNTPGDWSDPVSIIVT